MKYMNTDKKRYQECNIITKLYRRIRYQIPCFIYAIYRIIYNALFIPRNEREDLGLIYKILSGEWQSRDKANWIHALEELNSSFLEIKIYGEKGGK